MSDHSTSSAAAPSAAPSATPGSEAAMSLVRTFVDNASRDDVVALMRGLVEAKSKMARLEHTVGELQRANRELVLQMTASATRSLHQIEENRRLRQIIVHQQFLLRRVSGARKRTASERDDDDGDDDDANEALDVVADAGFESQAPPPLKRARTLSVVVPSESKPVPALSSAELAEPAFSSLAS
eukprot:Amastigsp_a174475_309.p1 type:complete len:184 gc:universal Amastigsp_a174475_309:694-143(-)